MDEHGHLWDQGTPSFIQFRFSRMLCPPVLKESIYNIPAISFLSCTVRFCTIKCYHQNLQSSLCLRFHTDPNCGIVFPSLSSLFTAPAACTRARSWVCRVRKGPEKCIAATAGQCHCTQAAMMRLYPVSNFPLRYACPPCLVVVRGRAAAPRLLVVV